MKILVTGGAGFIGSAVIRELLTHTQDTVINLDKLTYAGNLASIPQSLQSERYHFEQVDICQPAELRRVFTYYQPDAVMHLAAESHVDRSIDGPDAFMQTNLMGTFYLLEAARYYWQSLPKRNSFVFHHVSTDEVYGDLPHPDSLPANQSAPLFTEQSTYAPSSPYSASKAGSDHLVRSWHRTYKLPTIITNCSNNYGPYHFPEKLIPHMILNALAGKPLPVYGDGSQIRDWLYVEDHARALLQVVKQGRAGQTYNIGGHNEIKNVDVVKSLCKVLNELVPEEQKQLADYNQLITFVADRPGHDRRYAIDASKIQSELGWAPKETFASGLRKTVKWYLSNTDWWQAILCGEYRLNRIGV